MEQMNQNQKNEENEGNNKAVATLYYIENAGIAFLKFIKNIITPMKELNQEIHEVDNNYGKIKRNEPIESTKANFEAVNTPKDS